ncbi:uncharacterized protein [Paralichthys olivaceus]|uniref:uncharacterized protein n=1 Tax=Paralichthys olivaceus TaxID=8255 RepID=UPI0037524BFD
MDQLEERLIEEVRKYDHIYNTTSKNYKDCQMANNSWQEIAQNTGLEVAECTKRWKNLRDKFVRLRKKLATISGDPGSQKVPAFYHFLSWLAPHVKHRETESNYEAKTSCSSLESDKASTSASPTEPPRSTTPDLPAPPATPSKPPAFATMESPVSRFKRKRDQQDDLAKQMANLEDRRLELQQQMHRADECSRFGKTVADLLLMLCSASTA